MQSKNKHKSYIHTDIFAKQTSKYKGSPCGDVYGYYKDTESTTIVLSDGLGSGIKANIAANLCVSRILSLIKNGATVRETFAALTKTMNKAWGKNEPFAVFTIIRILNNGQTTILSYEMPPPIRLLNNYSEVIKHRTYTLEKAVVNEASCFLKKGEGLIVVSDGITQAGMGKGLAYGWEIKGVSQFVNSNIIRNGITEGQGIVDSIHNYARMLWGTSKGDDCSVVYIKNRNGVVVNLLSGPPADKRLDKVFVEQLIESPGFKVVCGGSSAKMVARELNTVLDIHDAGSIVTPPKYGIDGIDLVTEGVVTLNQVYNVLDENIDAEDSDSPVIELAKMLRWADRVNIWLGSAQNIGSENIVFRQQGIISRKKILNLIADKLIASGKLVVFYTEDKIKPN